MRNIMPGGPPHKPGLAVGSVRTPARLALLVVLGILTAAASGCGGKSDDTAARKPASTHQTPDSVAVAQAVPVTVDTSALDAWLALVDREHEGQTVGRDAYITLMSLPGYDLLSEGRSSLSPLIMQRVTTAVCHPDNVPRRPKRQDLVKNFTYVLAHRDGLDAVTGARLATTLWETVVRWLPADVRPQSLQVHVTVASPVIMLHEHDEVVLDAGLALAIGPDAAAHEIASHIYDELMPYAGPRPQEVTGLAAVRQTLRQLHHDAFLTWIAGGVTPRFDPEYPLLKNTDVRERSAAERASVILPQAYSNLETVLDSDNEAYVQKYGGAMDNLLRPAGRYGLVGYAMAEAIVTHSGEDALLALRTDPAGFLRAYQQAATTGDGNVPPFPKDEYAKLIDLLTDDGGDDATRRGP